MGALDIADLKVYLDLSGSADDARLTLAADGVDACAARYCGRLSFLTAEYVESYSVRSRDCMRLFTGVRPVLAVPRLALTLWNEGFPFAGADVDATANTITRRYHMLSTGEGPFRLATSGGLPAGLAAATDYWAINVSTSAIKLATSSANAEAGTAVDITTAGTGTHQLVGPMLDDPEQEADATDVDGAAGIVYLKRRGVFPQGDRDTVAIYTAGIDRSAALTTAAAVKSAHPALSLALLQQAAFEFRKMGKAGRLGEQARDAGGSVTAQYIVTDWAPGVLAALDSYRIRRV